MLALGVVMRGDGEGDAGGVDDDGKGGDDKMWSWH